MNDIQKINKDKLTFEDFKQENSLIFWWATDLMGMMGYSSLDSFKKVIDRAVKAFMSLGINYFDNIINCTRNIKGQKVEDFKLTRFASYLTVMNGDPKKPEVAAAQVYFVEQTRRFEVYIKDHKQFERIYIREELKDGHKALASAAKKAGIKEYYKFQNAGYLGMYNMYNWQLAKKRNISAKKLYDYMGRTELAANLFRITQTEEKIKKSKLEGQFALEQAHHDVGRDVRELVQKNTGVSPEDLPMDIELPVITKKIKAGYRKMIAEDKKENDNKEKI